MATIVKEPRMEEFREEQRQLVRSEGYCTRARLRREREDVKCVVAVAGVVTIMIVCGLGLSFTKTSGLSVAVHETGNRWTD